MMCPFAYLLFGFMWVVRTGGKIIPFSFKKVKISKKETEASLAKKILVQEHKLYPKAILKVFNL